MSAYVVVEASIRDGEALKTYGSKAGPIIKEFGGEVLVLGPWLLLFGEPAFSNGMIIRFADRERALAFYHSPAYQELLDIRATAFDCRFRLVD